MATALITPTLITWARERYSLTLNDAADLLKVSAEKLQEWELGHGHPTLNQAEKLADKFHIPFGYLFLSEPPSEDDLPLPDLRSVSEAQQVPLGPDFRDLLNDVLLKQEWYRDYKNAEQALPLPFIGKFDVSTPADEIAQDISATLGVDNQLRGQVNNWEAFLRELTIRVEKAGILVQRSGYIGSNTHRALRVEEFRGFVINDPVAPLIFLNGKDAKTGQIFTLAHELAHLWVGVSGISKPEYNPDISNNGGNIEGLCNQVAAEVLVPNVQFALQWVPMKTIEENAQDLAKRYWVSTLVILRRAYEQDLIADSDTYWAAVAVERAKHTISGGSGGQFYPTFFNRLSRVFATAVVSALGEGEVTYRDAANLLNVTSMGTLNEVSDRLLGRRLFSD